MNIFTSRLSRPLLTAISSIILLGAFLIPTLGVEAQNNGPCTIESAKFQALNGQPSWSDKNGQFYLGADFNSGGGGDGSEKGWFEENNTGMIVQVLTKNCAEKEIGIEVKSNRPGFVGETIEALQGKKFKIEKNSKEGYELLLNTGEEFCVPIDASSDNQIKDFYLNFLEDHTEAEIAGFLGYSSGLIPEYLSSGGGYQQIKKSIERYNSEAYDEGKDLVSFMLDHPFIEKGVALKYNQYIQQNFGQQISIPVPCEYYLHITSPDTTSQNNYDFIQQGNYLRYSCDRTSSNVGNICEGSGSNVVKWSIIKENPTIGGLVKIDESNPCYDENGDQLRKDRKDCQELLAPIPGFGDRVSGELNIGTYINTILQMVIGFMGIIAVLMIIASGVKYMTTESFGGKADAKSTISNAFLGLLIAVSIFIILSTINPDLLNLDPGLSDLNIGAVATVDNVNPDDSTESFGGAYKLTGSFKNPSPSSTTDKFDEAILALKAGAKITKVIADVGSGAQTDGRIYFHLDTGLVASAPTRTGLNGVAEEEQGVSGDKKTPKGKFILGGSTQDATARISISPSKSKAVLTNDGSTNMGAAFIGINIDPAGSYRGIGIHGNANNTLGGTYGCLRMYNNDLLIVAPHLAPGTPITIE